MMDNQDRTDPSGDGSDNTSTGGNWWEQPKPSYMRPDQPWPPPLPLGATYGPLVGQIIYGPNTGAQDKTGAADSPYPPPPPPPPAPPSYGGDNQGTPDGPAAPAPTGTLGGLLQPFTGTFTPPTPDPYPSAPVFTPPSYTPPPAFVPDQFTAPTADDALNDPGYKFAADEGERQLAQSKASGGVLNTGGTLKDILAWGQNYAAQRYGDVYNRNYNTYQGNEGAKERAYATNYQGQFVDPYKFAYQGALDTFNPMQSQWNTNMAATQRGNENNYANAYQNFLQSYNQFKDQRDSTFDKTFKYVTA